MSGPGAELPRAGSRPVQILAGTQPSRPRLVGDLGLAAFATPSIVRGADASLLPLPYAYLDYGRLFARIDTAGVKTLRLGHGYVEVAARVNFYGFDTEAPELRGLTKRSHSILLGVGTFQETPIGGFFLNAFHDMNDSGGYLLEGIYAARLAAGRVIFYPQAGVEYRDEGFVRYYYGVSPPESAASGYARYEPSGAVNPLAALHVEVPIAGQFFVNLYGRHKWLADAVTESPIVGTMRELTGFAALSYRFR